MNLKSALRWAAMYRGASWLGGLFVLALVVVGLYFGGPNRLPANAAQARTAMATPLFLAPTLFGLFVWQFVKTVAFYKTVTEATEEQMAQRFDSERVKSEVLEVLDDRLAEMQTEIQRTRKEVQSSGSTGPSTSATTGNTGSFDFES